MIADGHHIPIIFMTAFADVEAIFFDCGKTLAAAQRHLLVSCPWYYLRNRPMKCYLKLSGFFPF